MVPTAPVIPEDDESTVNPLETAPFDGEEKAVEAAETETQDDQDQGNPTRALPQDDEADAPETNQDPHTDPAPADRVEKTYLGQDVDREEPAPVPADVPEEDTEREFSRPFRSSVKHYTGQLVTLGDGIAEDLARDPSSIDKIYLPSLGKEVPVSEFTWTNDGTKVGE